MEFSKLEKEYRVIKRARTFGSLERFNMFCTVDHFHKFYPAVGIWMKIQKNKFICIGGADGMMEIDPDTEVYKVVAR